MQEVEDEAWSEPNISSCSLSQDILASTFSDEVIHDEEVSHTVPIAATLFDPNSSFFNQEQILKSHLFLYLLKLKIMIHLLMMLMIKKK